MNDKSRIPRHNLASTSYYSVRLFCSGKESLLIIKLFLMSSGKTVSNEGITQNDLHCVRNTLQCVIFALILANDLILGNDLN